MYRAKYIKEMEQLEKSGNTKTLKKKNAKKEKKAPHKPLTY